LSAASRCAARTEGDQSLLASAATRCLATLAAAALWLLAGAAAASAADPAVLQSLLRREVIGTNTALAEAQAFTESRVPLMPPVPSAAEWEKIASQMRRDTLDRVVFRGEAAQWRKEKTKVVWLETIEGGPGYRIRKLRYEAVPGLWIPALLYEPTALSGKAPVVLNVNGHEGIGKSVPYKQIRCINQARRGMIALNPEWPGMGQLRGPGYAHYTMNQLDLCGTSGLAPFYLAMARGLDVLLAHPHADPQRVAVAGLSGGGWQTIFLSSLDPRVTLANPVAGYSSFRTRARFLEDLGDSEQTPCDLATVADYAHLTALLAPRPALLTFNAKDNCCFASGHALQPLLDAAAPIYRLYGREHHLRAHVNHDPGDHNFGQDNREALYRMLGEHFFGKGQFNPLEIPCDAEVKAHTNLLVELPATNATFNSLALALSKHLPRQPRLPARQSAAESWQRENRAKLRAIVRAGHAAVAALRAGADEQETVKATFWRLRVDDAWTVPAVELVRGEPRGTVILVADGGRASVATNAAAWLAAGQRVLAVDPFYFGESRIRSHDFLFALLVAAVGERPLGIQAAQLGAVARWARGQFPAGPVQIVAVGPRLSTAALVAAALEEEAVAGVELHGALGSLKEVIEQNWGVNQKPELFCFGLLEALDVPHLAALVAPRPVVFKAASERVKQEMAALPRWYATLGAEFPRLE
jgi:hypothetical protein